MCIPESRHLVRRTGSYVLGAPVVRRSKDPFRRRCVRRALEAWTRSRWAKSEGHVEGGRGRHGSRRAGRGMLVVEERSNLAAGHRTRALLVNQLGGSNSVVCHGYQAKHTCRRAILPYSLLLIALRDCLSSKNCSSGERFSSERGGGWCRGRCFCFGFGLLTAFVPGRNVA